MMVVRLSAVRTAGDGTINLQDATQQNQCFSTYRNSFCLVVTFHTITWNLQCFFFPLSSFHHRSSVICKKHAGHVVNTNTWYESQRWDDRVPAKNTSPVELSLDAMRIASSRMLISSLIEFLCRRHSYLAERCRLWCVELLRS